MIKINLVAKKVPKEHILIQKQTVALMATMLVAFIVSGFWANAAFNKRAQVRAELEIEKTELARLEKVKAKDQDFKKKNKRREEILEAIQTLQAMRVGPTPFMDFLNEIMPPDLWFTNFSEKNKNIQISGYAFASQAVANLMRLMESSEHFSGVELSSIEQVVLKKEKVKKFTLTSTWGEPPPEPEEDGKDGKKAQEKKS